MGDTRTRTPDPQPTWQFGGELSTPHRLAYGLVPLIGMLEQGRHDVDRILAAADIPRVALEEPSFRITLAQELAFTRLCLAVLEDTNAAIECGRRFHLSMFGVLGLAAACAPTLREAFHLFVSYPALVWGLIEITLWREGSREYIRFEAGSVVDELGDYFIERDMVALLYLFRNTLGSRISPELVRLRRAAPANAANYATVFGCPVAFDAAANEQQFAREVWNAVPPQANAMSRRFFENQCRRLNEAMQAPFRYVEIVRGRLRHAIPIPGLSELAATLHLTPRTLQRRLASEGHGFADLLREVRALRATEMLRQQHLPIAQIAWRLGYREPDAFARAFRQWTGVAPSTFRGQR